MQAILDLIENATMQAWICGPLRGVVCGVDDFATPQASTFTRILGPKTEQKPLTSPPTLKLWKDRRFLLTLPIVLASPFIP